MKTFFKFVLFVVVIFILLSAAQKIFNFSVGELLAGLVGGTKLKDVHVNLSQEVTTPIFEVASLEIFYPKNLNMIEISKNDWWKLSIGTIFVICEFDTYIKLGIRNPHLIQVKRVGDTVYVDESSIAIEILDTKISNFKHLRTFTSNALVMKDNIHQAVFDSLNLLEQELLNNMIENGQSNFEFAKKNYMENYRLLCKSMGLNVVWTNASPEEV